MLIPPVETELGDGMLGRESRRVYATYTLLP